MGRVRQGTSATVAATAPAASVVVRRWVCLTINLRLVGLDCAGGPSAGAADSEALPNSRDAGQTSGRAAGRAYSVEQKRTFTAAVIQGESTIVATSSRQKSRRGSISRSDRVLCPP